MPLLYETTTDNYHNGTLDFHIEDLPFEEGTKFTVKIIPDVQPTSKELYQSRLSELQRLFQQDSPFKGMTKEQIVVELRRQREEIYDGE